MAQSAEPVPVGSVVEGAFVLARKVVPLPPGKFTVAMRGDRGTRNQPTGTQLRTSSAISEALLVQVEGTTFRIAVYARANADEALTRWTDEPCKRTDVLFRLDRTKSFDYLQDCVLITHRVGFLGKPIPATALVVDAFRSLGVVLPVRTVLESNLTRIEQYQYLGVSYWVNPDVFGFSTLPDHTVASSAWHPSRIEQDAARVAFLRALQEWSLALQPAVEQGFRGKAFEPSLLPALMLPTATSR